MKAEKLILGNFTTMDEGKPFAKAMIVADGRIRYVGSVKSAKALCDENTQVMDYGESFIYPGFLEAHAHPMFTGYRAIGQADLTPVVPADPEKYAAVIREFMAKNPDKEAYLAAGWAEDDNPEINASLLDKICPDKSLAMNTAGGHSILLNTKAKEFLGVDASFVKKWEAGLVRVDENGEPIGYLCEAPCVAILASAPISVKEAKEYVLWWQDFAFRNGFTGTSDAGTELIHKNAAAAHEELQREGKLKLRTYAYLMVKDNVDDPKARIEKIAQYAKENSGEYYDVVGAKVFLDGVTEAHTSWLVEDYKDQPGYHGNERFYDRKKMIELIAEAAKHGLSVHAHSEGDGATGFFLDCVEEAQRKTGITDQRNAAAHLHFVTPEDIQRMADTNTVAVVPPLWTAKIPGMIEQEYSYVGKEKSDKSYPIKSFFDAGAVTVFHSDYPVSPSFNAPLSVYMAVKRLFPAGVREGFGGPETRRGIEEAITREQALLAMTKNVARMWHQEDKIGSLEVGKIANMTILDMDLLHEDIEKIPLAKILATVVDGEEVYSCGKIYE